MDENAIEDAIRNGVWDGQGCVVDDIPASVMVELKRAGYQIVPAAGYTADGLPFETDPDEPPRPTEFDKQMIAQSQRMRCLKYASRFCDNAEDVEGLAESFFNWVTMTDEQRAQAAAVQAEHQP